MVDHEANNDNTRTHVVLTQGTMVSHYRIVDKIGAGGMGEVYLADDTQLDRKIALKFLPSHLCLDDDCRARFKREAQAVAKLDHPNIVTIHEVSEHQGRPFFTMQLVEGQSLRNLAKEKELGIDRIIELAIQICDGLGAAHDKKVVHRDIKPSNIVIDAYGRPKILDFGLAAIQGAEHLTNKSKIAISLDKDVLERLDRLVKKRLFPNRSRAIENAIEEKLKRLEKGRLARECSKLDPDFEKAMAEEGISKDLSEWPEY